MLAPSAAACLTYFLAFAMFFCLSAFPWNWMTATWTRPLLGLVAALPFLVAMLSLLDFSGGGPAAVDENDLTVDVACGRRSQEGHHVGDLAGPAKSLEKCLAGELLVENDLLWPGC